MDFLRKRTGTKPLPHGPNCWWRWFVDSGDQLRGACTGPLSPLNTDFFTAKVEFWEKLSIQTTVFGMQNPQEIVHNSLSVFHGIVFMFVRVDGFSGLCICSLWWPLCKHFLDPLKNDVMVFSMSFVPMILHAFDPSIAVLWHRAGEGTFRWFMKVVSRSDWIRLKNHSCVMKHLNIGHYTARSGGS